MLLLGCIYHGRPRCVACVVLCVLVYHRVFFPPSSNPSPTHSLAWAVGGCLGRRASSWVRSCVSLQRHPPVHHPGALWLAGWQAGRPCSSLRAKKEEEDSAAVPTKKKPAPAAATPKKKATTTKTSKKAVTPKQKPPPFEPNPLWLKQLEGIREMRRSADAPVDYFGCAELGKRHASSEKHMRFQTLISSMLSSQTTDIMNEKAMGRLYEACGITIEGLEALGEEGIVEAIKPVSFYTAKAANILKVCAILREKYDGDIPRTFDELMALPGCGPKMSVLVCAYAWNEVVGICVDTHVHRIRWVRVGLWVLNRGKFSPFPSTSSQQPPRVGQHVEPQESQGAEPREDEETVGVVDAKGALGRGTKDIPCRTRMKLGSCTPPPSYPPTHSFIIPAGQPPPRRPWAADVPRHRSSLRAL